MSVSQLCPTFCDLMDSSPPGCSAHGILQARILEWVAIPFSRGSSQHRDQTRVSCVAGGFFTIWATREAHRHIVGAQYKVSDWLRLLLSSGRQNNAPKYVHILNLGICECIRCCGKEQVRLQIELRLISWSWNSEIILDYLGESESHSVVSSALLPHSL